MRSMLLAATVLALLAVSSAAHAQIPFLVFKASVTLPVQFPGLDKKGNPATLVRKLGTNDIINLALGRSLATKPDKATEVLALAADDSTPGTLSKLVVYNPSSNSFTATVWTQSNSTLLSNPNFTNIVGVANANIVATTLGTPSQNGFSATVLSGGGTGKGTGGSAKAASTSLSGPLKFTVTDANNVTTTIDGIVIAGKFKAGGGSLGVVFE